MALLGTLNILSFLAYTVLSYEMAAVAPFEIDLPVTAEVYKRLADAVAPLGGAVQAALRGEGALAQRDIFLVAYHVSAVDIERHAGRIADLALEVSI